MTQSNDQWAQLEEEVPEDSKSASNQEEQTIMKAVAFSKHLAKADRIENMT